MTPLPAAAPRVVSLREWSTWFADSTACPVVPTEEDEALAERLREQKKLDIQFLRRGTKIQTSSYVGTVHVAGLTIRIAPKIAGAPLLALFAFARRQAALELLNKVTQDLSAAGIEEVLYLQLGTEVQRLLHRGLRREYRRTTELLGAPRGRIEFDEMARAAAQSLDRVPCTHYPRSLDTPVHRLLHGALELAASRSVDVSARRLLRSVLDSYPQVGRAEPTVQAIQAQRDALNRTNEMYAPALDMAEVIAEGAAIDLHTGSRQAELPGFLFDMNRFFQDLVARVLESDAQAVVQEEWQLSDRLRSTGTQVRSRVRSPRPDFRVATDGRVRLLDAKYRDFSEEDPGRDIVYQLLVYAFSRDGGGCASVVYPCRFDAPHRTIESWNEQEGVKATIALRGLNLDALAEAVLANDGRRIRELARQLVQPTTT